MNRKTVPHASQSTIGFLNLSSSPPCPRQVGEGEDCTQTTDLRVKTEPVCKLEPASPDPPPAEDQTEPVDLSLNKPRPSSLPSSAAGTTMNPAPSGMVTQMSATPVPSTIQTIGSMVNTACSFSKP